MSEITLSECVTTGSTSTKNVNVRSIDTTKKRNRGPFLKLTGKKFNRLTVIGESPYLRKDGYKHIKWICKCDCGKDTVVDSFQLRHGKTKSCGCYRDETGRSRMQKPPYFWLLGKLPKDKPSTLTYADLLEFVKIKNCHYCSDAVEWNPHTISRKGKRVKGKYNLDRKDNALGYSKENCVVCCSACNYLKGDKFTFSEMIELGRVLKCLRESRQIQGLPWIRYY